mmetsp:Transcript_11039/g.16907  ORF Transcript_11039/g.16907 Transcript_11039/m.16907 type:complete len:659 (+) Transcript_11039:72-2048(+)
MARHSMISDLDYTKTQLTVFVIILLLAVDSINPVKIFLHVFPSVKPWHVASVSLVLMIYVFISEFKALLYFSMKVFFNSIASIFFRSVEVVGRYNVPRHGPVIFVGNHANQFVDAIMMVCTCEFKISYLIAEKSWNRRVVGDMAWALGAVPVKRAQDYSSKGSGKITMKKSEMADNDGSAEGGAITVTGYSTAFMKELKIGDKVRPPGTATAMKVIKIENDTLLNVEAVGTESMDLPEEPLPFDILQRIDQKVVYGKVLETLAAKGAIGIFPEGGSHDRTDILPLKVGVALIAYSALEKDGISVPIVPVGLNYFQRNRFRGRAVVEYGEPVYIDPSTLSAYQGGGLEKRRVCNELLQKIEDAMKSVLVTAPDYESLQLIYTARRLWQRKELLVSEKQDLSRRFAEGYKQLLLQVNGKPPKEWSDLNDRIVAYQHELTELGIRDYQVPGLDSEKSEIKSVDDLDGDTFLREMRLPYQIFHVLFLMFMAAIPSVFLNLPVGLVARIYAEKRRKKALANSKVKIKAEDVLMTEKILICIVLVPTLWVVYALLLKFFTNLDGPAIALLFFCMPLFSYMSIMWAEAGMVEFKDLGPYVMRLFPSARRRIAVLPKTRKKLSSDVRAFIKKHGPSLGELYYSDDVDWKELQSKARRASRNDLKEE